MQTKFGAGSPIYQDAFNDPSVDNFKYYRDPVYDQQNTGILGRYKDFNNPHGNSPIADNNSRICSVHLHFIPDGEDLNRDNTLNETEEYFQYRIDIRPQTDPVMQVGQNFITDQQGCSSNPCRWKQDSQLWYQFRIPISKYNAKVGEIPDFKSIRFMRMFMTDFEDSTVLRFAKLELVRNNWRRFTYDFDTTGQYKPVDLNGATTFNVSAVNIEENDKRVPDSVCYPSGH